MKISHRFYGVIFILIATAGLSLKAIFIKLVYQASPDIDAITVLSLRFLMAAPLFYLLYLLTKKKNKVSPISTTDLCLLIVLGAIGFYLSAFLDFSALVYISAGLERLILFLYPTFVVILSFFIRKNEIRKNVVVALILSYVGMLIVFIEHIPSITEKQILGIILVFGAAIVFAIYTVASVGLIRKLGSIRYTVITMAAATGATLAHFFSLHEMVDLFTQTSDVYFQVMLMAVVSTFIPLLLMAEGIKRIGASSASILTTTGPVITLGLAYIILDEVFGLYQTVGALLIMVGIYFISKK